MNFATDDQVSLFFEQVVPFEQFLVDDGIHLIKIWLSVGRERASTTAPRTARRPAQAVEAQLTRRGSPLALGGLHHRRVELFRLTDTPETPWWFVNNNNKRVGRLNAIQHVLSLLPYSTRDEAAIGNVRQDIVAPVRALLPTIAPDS